MGEGIFWVEKKEGCGWEERRRRRVELITSNNDTTSSPLLLPLHLFLFPSLYISTSTTMLRSTGSSRTVSRLARLSSSPFAISRRAHSSSPPPSSSSYLPLPSQIHVLPFSIPPELALKRLAAFSIATSYNFSALFAWIGHQLLPSIFKDRIPLVNHQMIYIPAWSVQAKVTTKVTVVGKGDKLSVLKYSDQAVGWGEEAEDEMARMAEEEEKERKTNDGKRVFKLGVDSEFSFFPGKLILQNSFLYCSLLDTQS